MSVKRWTVAGSMNAYEIPEGGWVRYQDHEAEVERLQRQGVTTVEYIEIGDYNGDLEDRNADLEARVRELEAALKDIATLYENAEPTVTVDRRASQAYDMRCVARAALAAVDAEKENDWQTLAQAQPEADTMCQVRAANSAQFNASYDMLSDGRQLWAAALGGYVLTNPKDEWRAVDAEKGNDDE